MQNPFDMNISNEDDDSFGDVFVGTDNIPTTTQEPTPTKQEPVMSNPVSTDKKYHMIDMYWLINPKLLKREALEANQCGLLVIGYNADYSNLRIAFHETGNKSFTESSIQKHETKLLGTVNVFSETAMQILYAINTKQATTIHNFERLFTQPSNDWKPSASTFKIDPSKGSIEIHATLNGKPFMFTISEWHTIAFMDSLKFMTNGRSWMASLTC
jgi:hypothetical protein